MKLFDPGRIGKLLIKKRITMAAMGIGGLAEPDGRSRQEGGQLTGYGCRQTRLPIMGGEGTAGEIERR